VTLSARNQLDAAYKAAREFEEGCVDMILWMNPPHMTRIPVYFSSR